MWATSGTAEFRHGKIPERSPESIPFTETLDHVLNINHICIANDIPCRGRDGGKHIIIVGERAKKHVIDEFLHLQALNVLHLTRSDTFSTNTARNVNHVRNRILVLSIGASKAEVRIFNPNR